MARSPVLPQQVYRALNAHSEKQRHKHAVSSPLRSVSEIEILRKLNLKTPRSHQKTHL